MTLVLASGSAGRAALLTAAGVTFDVVRPRVDEDAAKAALRAGGTGARDLADALAELKALSVSRAEPGRLVLGSDQTLEREDGGGFDKPASRDDAAAQLRALRGRSHRLHSAAVLVEDGRPVWRHVESVRLRVRAFSDAWLDDYLDAEWPAIGGCVGGYRVEGRGIQLFEAVEGSQAAIVGLPLLPLLRHLRETGAMAS